MNKELKYGSYTATPSDYDSPDGDLASVLGLISEKGSLRPIDGPAVVLNYPAGRVAYVHETNSFKHYICVRDTGDVIEWINADPVSSPVALTNPHVSFHTSGILQFNAVGNTLVMLTEEAMYYYLWKPEDQGYEYLGDHLPELALSFGLRGDMVESDEFEVTFPYPLVNESDAIFNDENRVAVTNTVIAKVNKFIADEADKKGRFIFPFFVRYAYRLYDGSLTMHSAPILMICSSGITPTVIVTEPMLIPVSSVRAKVVGALHNLTVSGPSDTEINELKRWGDIVKSVDIFVSAPIYTYDQNGECRRIILNYGGNDIYSVCLLDNQTASTSTYPRRYQKHTLREMFSLWKNDFTDNPWVEFELPGKGGSDVKESIRNCSSFYILRSYELDNIPSLNSRYTIQIEENYLSSLVNREVMTDDYDSHDLVIPSRSFTYNSRLNLAGLRKKIFRGYPVDSMFEFTNGYVSPSLTNDDIQQVEVFFFVRQNGRTIVTMVSSSRGYGVNTPFLFLYYPNINAYKAVIWWKKKASSGNTFSYVYTEVPLEKHDFLNGAFFFDSWEGVESLGTTTQPTVTPEADCIVEISNKIYTSEVNDPFYFPLLGINTVGTGRILGISTAAKALSEGQFGQFPLYAFTTDGVWALEVSSSTGAFSARQPITRDVCINADSITQLDNSVLFATNRGVMMISGSNTKCITDVIDNDGEPFVFSSIPWADSIKTLLGLPANTTCLTELPFRTFLLGCRMIYSYARQQIIIFNPAVSYAYVYALESGQWGVIQSSIKSRVESYPEAYAMLDGGVLADFSEEGTTPSSQFALTRPLKLGMPDALKTITSVIQRGRFEKGHVKTILYGSRDLDTWFPVASSVDQYLRGFRGTPYKYFRIGLVCSLEHGESIYGASVDYEPRLTDQTR